MRVESPLPTKSVVKKNKKVAEKAVKIEAEENNENYTSTSKMFESKKYDFLKNLKLADWSKICDEANKKQSAVTFINAFDQCKELRIPVPNKLTTTSPVVEKHVDIKNINGNEDIQTNTSTLSNVRKSSRNKRRAGNSESSVTSDAETKVSALVYYLFKLVALSRVLYSNPSNFNRGHSNHVTFLRYKIQTIGNLFIKSDIAKS